jgi:release factor glutamine methyltransferase
LEAATDPDSAIELARRRADGEPLQYLTGLAGFRRLELEIGPGALVPRPETEMLVERVLTVAPRRASVVDVGTGSGAIALALADECPDARVLATDVSTEALTWARRNADRLGLPVELFRCDLMEGLPGELQGHIDVCVSNPPYVGTDEKHELPPDVVDHEPHEALFAGPGGLDVIERLVPASTTWLATGGWLIIEIAPRQADAVCELLVGSGFSSVTVRDDLVGRPRVAEGKRP